MITNFIEKYSDIFSPEFLHRIYYGDIFCSYIIRDMVLYIMDEFQKNEISDVETISNFIINRLSIVQLSYMLSLGIITRKDIELYILNYIKNTQDSKWYHTTLLSIITHNWTSSNEIVVYTIDELSKSTYKCDKCKYSKNICLDGYKLADYSIRRNMRIISYGTVITNKLSNIYSDINKINISIIPHPHNNEGIPRYGDDILSYDDQYYPNINIMRALPKIIDIHYNIHRFIKYKCDETYWNEYVDNAPLKHLIRECKLINGNIRIRQRILNRIIESIERYPKYINHSNNLFNIVTHKSVHLYAGKCEGSSGNTLYDHIEHAVNTPFVDNGEPVYYLRRNRDPIEYIETTDYKCYNCDINNYYNGDDDDWYDDDINDDDWYDWYDDDASIRSGPRLRDNYGIRNIWTEEIHKTDSYYEYIHHIYDHDKCPECKHNTYFRQNEIYYLFSNINKKHDEDIAKALDDTLSNIIKYL